MLNVENYSALILSYKRSATLSLAERQEGFIFLSQEDGLKGWAVINFKTLLV